MKSSQPSRWERCGRILCSWLFILLGVAAAVPAIGCVTELILPPAIHWTWDYYLNRTWWFELSIAMLAYPVLTYILWSIAWGVRTGRPPRPTFFYVAGALTSLLGLTRYVHQTAMLPVALIYFFVGGVMHVLSLMNRAEPLNLPSSAGALLDRLVILFPAFREYWHGDIERLSNSADPNAFRDVLEQFSRFFQEHYQRSVSRIASRTRPFGLDLLGIWGRQPAPCRNERFPRKPRPRAVS